MVRSLPVHLNINYKNLLFIPYSIVEKYDAWFTGVNENERKTGNVQENDVGKGPNMGTSRFCWTAGHMLGKKSFHSLISANSYLTARVSGSDTSGDKLLHLTA